MPKFSAQMSGNALCTGEDLQAEFAVTDPRLHRQNMMLINADVPATVVFNTATMMAPPRAVLCERADAGLRQLRRIINEKA